MTKKRIHLLYSIALSAILIIAGICLCVACVGIYRSGTQPFSREAVAAAFGYIAVPVYLCLALVVGGFILDGFWPWEKRRPADKQYRMILSGLQKKLALDRCDSTLQADILRQRKRRCIYRTSALALLAIGTILFLSYAVNPGNFHQSEINNSMIQAMKLFALCFGIPFCFGTFTAYAEKKSILDEITLTKQALADGCRCDTPATPTKGNGMILYVRLALLCLGICILVYGFIAGGTADVLTKAVNICTECVGLG